MANACKIAVISASTQSFSFRRRDRGRSRLAAAFKVRSELVDFVVTYTQPKYLEYHGTAVEWDRVTQYVEKV